MLAVVAGVIFIIAAVIGLVSSTVTLGHLLALAFAGLAFLAGHLALRFYGPSSRL